MKNLKFLLLIFAVGGMIRQSIAQSINWESLQRDHTHIVTANAGWDYGFVYGVGYGYQFNTHLPLLLTAAASLPAGEQAWDDFKTKVGGQIRLYQIRNFQVSAEIQGIYRRYENPLVQLQNFGSELTGVAGYYKSSWYVAVELGFDKAIVTHVQHSDSFREHVYAEVQDGWVEPSSGGNVHYGLQTGYSFNRHDITLKIGKVTTQDFKTSPSVPFYVQLGYNLKINGSAK